MNAYILREIDHARRQLLIEAGVYFDDWGGADILVDQQDYQPALVALSAAATSSPSDYEGIAIATLRYSDPPRPDPGAGANQAEPAATSSGVRLAPAAVELSPAERNDRMLDPARAQARHRYIEASSAKSKSTLIQASNVVNNCETQLHPLQAKYATQLRQHHVAQDQSNEEVRAQRFQQEYQRLIQVAKVASVRVTAGAILVYTQMLNARKPGTAEEHEIGRFIIVIRTDGQGVPVSWFNQTRLVDGIRPMMNAPYIRTDGSPFVNETLETFIQLIAQFEFAVVTELAIQFVESIDGTEPGKYLDRWPAANRA